MVWIFTFVFVAFLFFRFCFGSFLADAFDLFGFWLFWCSKSLIKMTKSRIEVIRRKRNATLKFLKKDIADLLANGLDINAYGRVIFSLFFFFGVIALSLFSLFDLI